MDGKTHGTYDHHKHVNDLSGECVILKVVFCQSKAPG